MANYTRGSRQDNVNRISPAAAKAKLGDQVAELTDQVNSLTTQFKALLTKLDANHGAATDHAATLAPAAASIKTFDQR